MRYIKSLWFILLIMVWVVTALATDTQEKSIAWVSNDDDKAGLGLVLTDIENKAEKEEGVRVLEVIEDSEAAKAGIQKNDIIIEINGENIKSLDDVSDIVKDLEDNQEVNLVTLREGSKKTFKLKMSPIKKSAYKIKIDDAHVVFSPQEDKKIEIVRGDDFGLVKEDKGAFLGVQVKELSDQLLKYFEVKHGVLIEAVNDDSPAQKAGLKAGDVITNINDRKIEDYADLIRTVNYYNPGEQVEVKYVQKGKAEKTKVVLGKKKGITWKEKFGNASVVKESDLEESDKDQKIKKKIRIMSPEGEIKDVHRKILIF